MKDLLTYFSLLLLLTGVANIVSAQYVYTIKADSVKITNCDSSELIIENHTQAVPGFLFNTGNGRTVFKHGLIKLNDSLYLSGADTLNLNQGLAALLKANNGLSVSGGKVVLGNDAGDTSAGLQSDRYIPVRNKWIRLTDPASGSFTMLSSGIAYIEKFVTNSSGFGPMLTVYGTSDYLNNTPNQYINETGIWSDISYFPHGTTTNSQISNSSFGINDQFAPNGAGNYGYTAINIAPYYDFTNYSTGTSTYRDVRGIWYNPYYDGTVPHSNIAYENSCGDNLFNSGFQVDFPKGKAGFQGVRLPTAYVHIGAGTSAAGSAPLKINSGVLLTTPENGAIEYDGTDLYLTKSNTRYKLVKALTGQLSTNFGGSSLSASGAVTATLSVTGVQPGDVVSVNANSGAVNPPQIIITA
ncbi:MAG: hypothetical protein ABUL46_05005, partial [Chitinophaga rupis]